MVDTERLSEIRAEEAAAETDADRLARIRAESQPRRVALVPGVEVDAEGALGTLGKTIGAFGAGANKAIAAIVGLPSDALNFLLRQAGIEGSEAFLGSSATFRPLGFTLGVENLQTTTGEGIEPTTGMRIAGRIGEEFGAAPAFLLPIGLAGRGAVAVEEAAAGARGLFRPLTEAFRTAPAATTALDLTAAAGGGLGAGLALEAAPDNQLAEFGGQVAGGLGLATVPTAVRAAARPVTNAFDTIFAGGRQRIAARGVQESATDPAAAVAALDDDVIDLPGAVFTSAQITNDPGLLSLERSVARSRSELGTQLDDSTGAVNAAARNELEAAANGTASAEALQEFLQGRITRLVGMLDERTANAVTIARQRIEEIGPKLPREDASTIAREEIEAALKSAREQETALWQAIYRGRNVNTGRLDEELANIRAAVRKADRPEDIPQGVAKVIDEFGDVETVDEILALRSRILADIRTENGKDVPNRTAVANLNRLQEAALGDLGVLSKRASAEGADQIRATLDFSRQLNDRFTRGPIGRLLGFDARGGARVPTIETLDKLIKPDIAGASNADAIVNVLVARMGEGNVPSASRLMGGIKDFITGRFIEAATDTAGNVVPTAARQFVTKFAPVLARFPGLGNTLKNATNALQLAGIAQRSGQRLTRNVTDASRSRAALFLDRDLGQSMQAILRSKKPTAVVAELIRQTRRDPTGKAFEGLKSSFFDTMIRQVELKALDQAGQPLLSAANFRTFMRDNAPVIRQLYKPDEIARMRRVGDALNTAERSTRPGIRGAVISPSSPMLIHAAARIVGGTAGARAGAAVGGSPLVSANILARLARKVATETPETAVRGLIERAVFDPDVMKTMLTKPTRQNAPQIARRLEAHLAGIGVRGAVNADIQGNGQQQGAGPPPVIRPPPTVRPQGGELRRDGPGGI